MKSILPKLKNSFNNSSLELFKIFVIYLILDFILRVYEYFLTSPYFTNSKLLELQTRGLYQDVFKYVTLLFLLFPVYLIIRIWVKRYLYYSISFVLLFYVILSFVATQYYIVSFVPLDQSFYSYSVGDLIKIMNSSSDINLISYLVLGVVVILFFVLQKSLFFKSKYYVIAIWVIWIVSVPNITYSHVKAKFFSNIQNYYLVKGKGLFFLEESIRYFKNTEESEKIVTDIISLAKKYVKIYPENKYVIAEYPLVRMNNDEDVLGKYFRKNDTLPNIVFLILESMGRNICGPNARFGSFTPFLDSLMQKSLYWENCLSNAERTYGAIPNILGSFPDGPGGFYYHEDKALPSTKSLISYLNDVGYRSGFYYGGWSHFQNMDDMLYSNNIDYILNDFDSTALKIQSDKEGFSWGFDDKSLFEQYFKVINSDSIKDKRRLDILLTLSLHSPFMPPNKEYFENEVEKISDKLSPIIRKEIIPYKNVLATVVYVDDAVRGFFNKYKKRDDFNNTIFIIAADHNLHAFPDDNEIRKFHIPLLIYSPMLNTDKRFSSINSHREIAPSILAFLKNKYGLKFDENIQMMGNVLDDNEGFRSNKTLTLLKGNGEKFSLLDKEYFMTDGKYYRLNKEMSLEKIDNDSIKKVLDFKLKVIKDINKYVYNQNKIIPPKYILK